MYHPDEERIWHAVGNAENTAHVSLVGRDHLIRNDPEVATANAVDAAVPDSLPGSLRPFPMRSASDLVVDMADGLSAVPYIHPARSASGLAVDSLADLRHVARQPGRAVMHGVIPFPRPRLLEVAMNELRQRAAMQAAGVSDDVVDRVLRSEDRRMATFLQLVPVFDEETGQWHNEPHWAHNGHDYIGTFFPTRMFWDPYFNIVNLPRDGGFDYRVNERNELGLRPASRSDNRIYHVDYTTENAHRSLLERGRGHAASWMMINLQEDRRLPHGPVSRYGRPLLLRRRRVPRFQFGDDLPLMDVDNNHTMNWYRSLAGFSQYARSLERFDPNVFISDNETELNAEAPFAAELANSRFRPASSGYRWSRSVQVRPISVPHRTVFAVPSRVVWWNRSYGDDFAARRSREYGFGSRAANIIRFNYYR